MSAEFASYGLGEERVVVPRRRVDQAELNRYAWASGDYNPIHWNDQAAKGVGLPGVIGHGMLTLAHMGRAAEDLAVEIATTAGRSARVGTIDARFTGMLSVDDDLTVSAKAFRGNETTLWIHLWAYRNGQRDQLVCTASVAIELG